MITHDVDEAILLADKILLMSNGPVARVAEVVCNTLPRDRQRATLHHEPGFYELRNHLVDFLVSRSKDLSRGRAPAHPPEVRPADAARRPSTTAATPGGALHLQRVA
jgi:nitrate/nitrite transport system ATP-binding protein